MAKSTRTSQRSSPAHSDTPNQTTDDSDEKPFDPTRSKEEKKIYEEAQEVNREHDFVKAVVEARAPPPAAEYVPPAPPPAVVDQTRMEMEAGKKRVEEFEAQEEDRKEVHERNKRDKWADKGSTPVFRPDDYVPDQKKGQGNVTTTSAPLKE